jgi:hypothetical protein
MNGTAIDCCESGWGFWRFYNSVVLDNADRFSRNMPPPLHEGEEAIGQSPPAAVALGWMNGTAIDCCESGWGFWRFYNSVAPIAQRGGIFETNERDAPPNGQGSQRASKCVGQRRDGQNEPQKDVPPLIAVNLDGGFGVFTTRWRRLPNVEVSSAS